MRFLRELTYFCRQYTQILDGILDLIGSDIMDDAPQNTAILVFGKIEFPRLF